MEWVECSIMKEFMKIRKYVSVVLLVVMVGLQGFALTGCSGGEQPTAKGEKTSRYTCPMHAEVVQDKPGSCPKCGMKLVEKK
jgi:hypothetical protein